MTQLIYTFDLDDVQKLLEGGAVVLPDKLALPAHINETAVQLHEEALQYLQAIQEKPEAAIEGLLPGIARLLWERSRYQARGVMFSPQWDDVTDFARVVWLDKAEAWAADILGLSPEAEAPDRT